MQQSCVFVFILIFSFFLVLVITIMVSVIVSEIKMEKMINQFIQEMENEIGYNKKVVDINNRGESKNETNN